MNAGLLWLIGGIDPTAGAGVLRDAVTALEVAPTLAVRTAVTALTRQGHGDPATVRALDNETIRWQLDALPSPTAIKIGLVPSGAEATIVEALQRCGDVPVVLDPVLRASDGGDLGARLPSLQTLLSRAALVTPNDEELRQLTRQHSGEEAARWWMQRWPHVALLHKAAVRDTDQVEDHLWIGERRIVMRHALDPGPDPRGTGCSLATAIASDLARGVELVDAVSQAVAWLINARRSATRIEGEKTRLGTGDALRRNPKR